MFFKNNSRVVFRTKPTRLNKGFDQLLAIVHSELRLELDSNTYFLFCNKKKDRVKILYLDGDNLAIWAKRIGCTLVFKYEKDVVVFDQNEFTDFLKRKAKRLHRKSVF